MVSAFGFFLGFEFFNHLPQLAQGEVLDLPDAFARDAEFRADLLQSFFRAAIEAEPVAQNRRFARSRCLTISCNMPVTVLSSRLS